MTDLSAVWKNGLSKEITFIVTKDCQLACKYCYLVGKNSNERMAWETAKQTVDFILSQENDELFDFESVVFDFIGGEPFIEIDLIDRICDYLKMQMYLRNHHWFNSYRFSITTNGINYDSPKVQEFIRKNKKHLSITITLDGTQKKHDLNRVWRNDTRAKKERGSYDDVVRNVPLWLQQFPHAATKVTISSPDIPFVCESVLHLFSLGIHTVHINCVFENVWQDGDDIQFEYQLRMLADTMLKKHLYQDYECSLFDRSIGLPMDAKQDKNWCGAGLMLSIDSSGNLYPCTRFAKYSLREKPSRVIGHIDKGIDKNKVRPFYSLSRSIQSTKECFECKVASGCAWCQGENYDCADSQTIFQRSTAICKMHKARVRANQYYWAKVDQQIEAEYHIQEVVDSQCKLDKSIIDPNTVIVLLATDSTSFCIEHYREGKSILLPLDLLADLVKKAEKRQWKLQFVYPAYKLPEEYILLIDSIPHKDIVPALSPYKGDCVVLNGWDEIGKIPIDSYCIIRTSLSDFYMFVDNLDVLLGVCKRLSVVFTDERTFSDEDVFKYKNALDRLTMLILKCWQESKHVAVNLITDRLHLAQMNDCGAGCQTVTLAPNGHFYICPSFYYSDEDNSCGSLEKGIDIKNPLLYKLDHAPLCSPCRAYHCQRCVYLNKCKTLEVNIPSFEQCKKSELELEATREFYTLWQSSMSS